MTFLKKSSKKALIILIMPAIALNIVGYAIAKENKEKEVAAAPNTGIRAEGIQVMQPDIEGVSVTGAVYDSNWEDVAQKIQEKANEKRAKRLHKKDRYNYSKQEIEELILDGASIEDIYYSDYIGNEWLVDPKELMKQKKESNNNWEEIENRIQVDKEEKLAKLLQIHSKVEKKLSKISMNTAEKLALMELVAVNGEAAFEQALSQLQSQGLIGLELDIHLDVTEDLDPSVTDDVYGMPSVESEIIWEGR